MPRGWMDGQTDGRMDGRQQEDYNPRQGANP